MHQESTGSLQWSTRLGKVYTSGVPRSPASQLCPLAVLPCGSRCHTMQQLVGRFYVKGVVQDSKASHGDKGRSAKSCFS